MTVDKKKQTHIFSQVINRQCANFFQLLCTRSICRQIPVLQWREKFTATLKGPAAFFSRPTLKKNVVFKKKVQFVTCGFGKMMAKLFTMPCVIDIIMCEKPLIGFAFDTNQLCGHVQTHFIDMAVIKFMRSYFLNEINICPYAHEQVQFFTNCHRAQPNHRQIYDLSICVDVMCNFTLHFMDYNSILW